VGLGAERSPSLEGLPVPYSVEPGRWRSVASVHGSVGGRGPISGAVNAHVTRAGHLGVSQWRVSDVLSGAGPAPTGGGAATDAPARIARDRRVTAA